MQFYEKDKAGKIWYRNPISSTLRYLMDCLIFMLPVKRLPYFMSKLLYGVNADFVFFIHPRRMEDIFVAFPILVYLRKIIGRKAFIKFLHFLPPFVLSTVKTDKRIDGIVVGSLFIPGILLKNKRASLRESLMGLFFCAKICKKNAIIGLGGLWPMVTRRGIALRPYAKKRNIRITNGHCGTLISLYLMIEKIAKLSEVSLDKLKIVILGIGKMGTNLARALYGKVATLTLIDINERRLDRAEEQLRDTFSKTDIQKFVNSADIGRLRDIFENNHIGVCTTSNIRGVLRREDIPKNTIIIDDARPEGIPRHNTKDAYVVIEGGLMKIKGIKHYYDYGFGIDENVFGCLAESYLLAADDSENLMPTLGDVDFENFKKMLQVIKRIGVEVGDFKSRRHYIEASRIINILKSKSELTATIPFKNVCWLFKIEDLL